MLLGKWTAVKLSIPCSPSGTVARVQTEARQQHRREIEAVIFPQPHHDVGVRRIGDMANGNVRDPVAWQLRYAGMMPRRLTQSMDRI